MVVCNLLVIRCIPVDYVVFNGMKKDKNSSGKSMKNIILLDSERKSTEQRHIQRGVEKAVEQESYEWITLRVDENGGVRED